jgi:hypothetical protein
MSDSSDRTHKDQTIRRHLEIFRSLFVAREDAHAIWMGKHPIAVREPLSDEVLTAHLAGESRVGTYLINSEGKTPFLVFDIDVPKESLVRRIAKRLRRRGVVPYVERSKSKVFHIWVFFEKPLRAVEARTFAGLVLLGLDTSKIEVFPKQDEVREGGFGNCISLPLFGPDIANKRTIFLDEDFDPIKKQWSLLRCVERVARSLVREACRKAIGEADELRGHSKSDVWPINKGTRNKMLTSIAGALRHQGATEEIIVAALLNENQERCDPPLSSQEVKRIATSVSKYPPGKRTDGRTRATKLVAALADDLELFHTPEKEPYISLRVGDHYETYRIADRYIRRWVAKCYFERFGGAIPSHSLKDVLSLLEALALFKGAEEGVFTRLAQRDGSIYVDLCNEAWQAVEITRESWKIISSPPVKFRRAPGMLSLPIPVQGGSIAELRRFLNVGSENDFVLCVSWLVAALNAQGPFPVLVLQGEAGSAKSTAVRVLRDLVDPNTTPLRSQPREIRDLMIAARNSWCTAFDNVSHLPPWLSDALCQLATGGGFGTRMLYTDDEERLFQATRPIIMNGIDGTVTRGDLLDRALLIYLPLIPDDQRKPEKKFWRKFRKSKGRIFGVLLNAVSCSLDRLNNLRLNCLPRMADFAQWATAAEPALGWEPCTLMRAYDNNRTSANTLALDSSPLVPPLRRLTAHRPSWKGTAEDLLRSLVTRTDHEVPQRRDWPRNPQVLSSQLRRIAPNLRVAGTDVQFDEKTSGSGSKRIIRIERRMSVANVRQPEKVTRTIRRFPRIYPPFRFPRLKPDASDASDASLKNASSEDARQ